MFLSDRHNSENWVFFQESPKEKFWDREGPVNICQVTVYRRRWDPDIEPEEGAKAPKPLRGKHIEPPNGRTTWACAI